VRKSCWRRARPDDECGADCGRSVSALDSLSSERGAQTGLAQALKKLSRMNPEARKIAAPAETALEQAYALAEERGAELDSLLSRLDGDTNALERKEERLFALRALARK
jgi:DNA repair protein RecN (Recombination protein N)